MKTLKIKSALIRRKLEKEVFHFFFLYFLLFFMLLHFPFLGLSVHYTCVMGHTLLMPFNELFLPGIKKRKKRKQNPQWRLV